MFGLPKSSEYNRRIPKQKFYDNINITPGLKRLFIEQINNIYWTNKIASSTVNIPSGNYVNEIEVFYIKLNTSSLDEKVLKQIDKAIPYQILFILEYHDKYQSWISYKGNSNSNVKTNSFYHTDWLTNIDLKLEGLTLDSLYENLIRQIAKDELYTTDSNEQLDETIDKTQKKKELQKQIEILQKKIKNEKQLNRQVEMNGELRKLRSELEEV